VRILGKKAKPFGGGMGRIDWVKPRIAGKDVLDVGVIQHDPANQALDNWLRRHVVTASKSCVGIDSDAEGVAELRRRGEDVSVGDACPLPSTGISMPWSPVM
jgi:hypothetical protein